MVGGTQPKADQTQCPDSGTKVCPWRKGTAGGSCSGGHRTAVRFTHLQACSYGISQAVGEGIDLGLGVSLLGNVLVPLTQMQYVCV